MKILKIAGITMLTTLIIYFIVIIVLPSKVFVERSIIVDASPVEAYSYLEDLRNFQEWAYWAEIDPNTVYKYTGPSKGVGSKMDWDSKHIGMGYGSWWIISTTPYSQIKCNIQLREFAKPAIMEFNFFPDEGGLTTISWNFQTDFYGRWKFYVSMMESELGPAFEKSLFKMKRVLENLQN